MTRTLAIATVLVLAASTSSADETKVTTSAELRAAASSARPGARILVAPGDYEGLYLANVHGEAKRPVVIAGADPKRPPVFKGQVHLSEVSHLELAHVVVTGSRTNGINVDDGGSFETPSHHVVLRDLVVKDVGARGNEDGIKLSGLDDFQLVRCTVERWGRGGSAVDMVGCHRGTIEDCTFRDSAERPAATGVQNKGGTASIAIRRCRFVHAGERAVNVGGSTGLSFFRPKVQGFEAKDITVEGCTFTGSAAPIAFVGVDGATVRFNTFYRPRKWFARILQETTADGFVPCRNGRFTDNLVVFRTDEVTVPVNVGPRTAPETFAFERNYWFALDAPARSRPAKLPTPEKAGAGGQDPLLRDPEKGDFSLAPKSPAAAHGAMALPGR